MPNIKGTKCCCGPYITHYKISPAGAKIWERDWKGDEDFDDFLPEYRDQNRIEVIMAIHVDADDNHSVTGIRLYDEGLDEYIFLRYYDSDGEQLWRNPQLDTANWLHWGRGVNHTANGDILVGTGQALRSFAQADGSLNWSQATGNNEGRMVEAANGNIFFRSFNHGGGFQSSAWKRLSGAGVLLDEATEGKPGQHFTIDANDKMHFLENGGTSPKQGKTFTWNGADLVETNSWGWSDHQLIDVWGTPNVVITGGKIYAVGNDIINNKLRWGRYTLAGVTEFEYNDEISNPDQTNNPFEQFEGMAIAVDSQGDVYVLHNPLFVAAGNVSVQLTKFDPAGNRIWQIGRTESSGAATLNCISVDSEDNIYVGGGRYKGTNLRLWEF